MRFFLKGAVFLVLSAALPAFTSIERLFAPDVELWPRWQAHDLASREVINHDPWDALLGRYVRPDDAGVNRVDYRRFKEIDGAALKTYIAALSNTEISRFNRDEQIAFWINLYNAVTVEVILDHFPVESIRDIDISPGLFSDGPWGKKLVSVEGEELSLNDIEHRILRPIWRDPRIHYAVNCASVGCPDLRQSAYRGSDIDDALDEAAQGYINDPRGVAINDGDVVVSKIYDWFIEDFGGDEAGVFSHLLRYAAPDLGAQLMSNKKLTGTKYDWSLNAGEN